ncbi:MAG: 23S rRNA (guanosine(2251)-2'-O)-methyltransferase RlmB [Clostridiales bacterium]|nr:MAG: 23S rRNA (guanosine(2251)-2'-O)-methyltransferase RlmB [Clostridiales bacterium]
MKKDAKNRQTYKQFQSHQKKRSFSDKSKSSDYAIGIHPVEEAIKGGRTINKIMVAKGKRSKRIHDIIVLAKERRLFIQEVDSRALDRLSDAGNHQGVVAYLSPYDYYPFDDMAFADNSLVLALNDLTDVHNFGSILRTCEAVGVAYVIIPERRSVQVNATVTKTSAGAVEHVKIVRVKSLGNALNALKEQGFWVIGADMNGDKAYDAIDYSGKKVIVMGAEDKGLSPHIVRLCDYLTHIPMHGKVNSLNVSVATSLLLYEWRRQQK